MERRGLVEAVKHSFKKKHVVKFPAFRHLKIATEDLKKTVTANKEGVTNFFQHCTGRKSDHLIP